jgi:ribose transport system substrate-binding protein
MHVREECMRNIKAPGRSVAFFTYCCAKRVCLYSALFGSLLCLGTQASEFKAVGVLLGDLGNPFFDTIGRRAESAVSELLRSPVKVTVLSSGYDLARQIEQINDFIAADVDLLLINAVNSTLVGPALERAKSYGVIVVAVDTAAQGAQATVQSDNFGAGKLVCNYLAERLEGKGAILIMNGPPVTSVTDRVEGCKSSLSAFPGITILADDEDCGGSFEGGLSYMTEAVNRYPHFDAVFAINDPTALGADVAATRANRSDFFIVSIDGSPGGVKVIAEAKTRLVATVAQDPLQMTDMAVSVGWQLFEGSYQGPSTISMPIHLVTRDDVKNYRGWDLW